jgi:hypothetical protein
MRSALIAAFAAATVAAAACETVDLGKPPSDINTCRPSQSYFIGAGPPDDAGVVRSIWTDILTRDFGGKRCSDSACHGSGSTNSLRLMDPFSCTPPYCPIPLTQEWESNYRSTAEQMNCSNVSASKLLEWPSGLKNHFGGKLFEPTGPEADLIIGWVGAPP